MMRERIGILQIDEEGCPRLRSRLGIEKPSNLDGSTEVGSTRLSHRAERPLTPPRKRGRWPNSNT